MSDRISGQIMKNNFFSSNILGKTEEKNFFQKRLRAATIITRTLYLYSKIIWIWKGYICYEKYDFKWA